MSTLSSAVSAGMSNAVSHAHSGANRVVSALNSAASGARAAGMNTGYGFGSGLAGTAGYIYSVANTIANNVAATIRRAMDIHSPSRVMKSLGGYTGEGFAIGMSDWISEINAISKEYALAVTDQNWGVNSSMAVSGNVNNSGINSSLESLSDEVKNTNLSEPVFEVHTELVGDKIYTTVKEKEAREEAKNGYFNYA